MPFATGPQPPPSCRTSVRYMRQCAALNMPRYVHCGVVTDHDSRLQSASYQPRLSDCNQRGLNAEFKGVGRMANYNHRRGIRITHAPHHVEMRLDQILPALPLVNLFLLDPQRLVDRERLSGAEDPAVVGDQTLRDAEALQGGIEHDQDTGQVL